MSLRDFSIATSAIIAAPASVIRSHIRDLHKWEAWSPWQELDPEMSQTYSGSEAGVGAKMAWSGNDKAGSGAMTVVSDSDELVEIDIEFIKPFAATNRSHFTLADRGDGTTQVTWTMTGQQNLFAKVFFKIFRMEKQILKDFDRGLTRLNTVVSN